MLLKKISTKRSHCGVALATDLLLRFHDYILLKIGIIVGFFFRCWVAGWGKNMFGLQGQYQQILKKVDVPIVAPATCQSQLQAARLGTGYVLDTASFVCAGGEASKDSCTVSIP